jgi:hypothetical protein
MKRLYSDPKRALGLIAVSQLLMGLSAHGLDLSEKGLLGRG